MIYIEDCLSIGEDMFAKIGRAMHTFLSLFRFMSVQDVKKYWELKGFFVSLRRSLEDWLYNVKLDKLKPSR